ncbi:hypothetical protein NXC14_PA00361 (plasmid) [Rhizobium sp. NXC14]|nr:hypothetical protein NXC14_PA00361 [Rhizobium sp. NXC14]
MAFFVIESSAFSRCLYFLTGWRPCDLGFRAKSVRPEKAWLPCTLLHRRKNFLTLGASPTSQSNSFVTYYIEMSQLFHCVVDFIDLIRNGGGSPECTRGSAGKRIQSRYLHRIARQHLSTTALGLLLMKQ